MRLPSRVQGLLSNRRVRGFLAMSGGTIFSLVVTLAALPLISRLYSPADFGVLSLVLAISGIISPAVALRFDGAILLPTSLRKARSLVSLSVFAVIVISIVWALLSDFVARMIFQTQAVSYLAFWVFSTTLLTGLFTIFSEVAIRERRYRDIAVRSIYQSTVTAGTQTGFGALSWGSTGLLAGSLFGRLAGVITLIFSGRRLIAKHRWREMGYVFREYWRFPVVFAPSAILNSLGLQLPLIVLAAVYGIEFAGQLGMAERIVAIPITVLGMAIGQVFIGEIAQLRRSKRHDYTPLFIRLSAVLLVVSVVALGTLVLIAGWIVPTLLGENWSPSIPLVQILALTGAVRLVATPLAGAITLFQRARANIVIDAVRISLMTVAILVTLKYSPRADIAIWLIYGSLAIIYVITWIYVYVLLKRESRVGYGAHGTETRLEPPLI